MVFVCLHMLSVFFMGLGKVKCLLQSVHSFSQAGDFLFCRLLEYVQFHVGYMLGYSILSEGDVAVYLSEGVR